MTSVAVEEAAHQQVVVRSTPLGGSALSRALQSRAPGTSAWIAEAPSSADAWKKHIGDVQAGFAGADWLSRLAPAFAASGPAGERLAAAAAGGVVVTTGQQPGLFGGPAYTWSKAISALAFADALQEATGTVVAPVFWAATDDSDWHEAASTFVAGARGLQQLSLDGPPTQSVSMSNVPLGDTSAQFGALEAASGSASYAQVLEMVADAYTRDATVGASYVQLLRALLEPLGVAVLDASHPAFRAAADPFLRRALVSAYDIRAALSRRSGEISNAGFVPQVETMDDLSLVFRSAQSAEGDAPLRERVPMTIASRTARDAAEGELGANVLLRPVLERHLLPTVAYHAGPGEYAYFAQVEPVARTIGAAVPVAVPRWSGEVIEPAAFAAMERLGLVEHQLRTPHEAEQHVARMALDESAADAIERLRLAVETQVRALADPTVAGMLVSERVIDGLGRDLAHRVDRFERRVLAAVKQRETEQMRFIAVARAHLFPLGKSPERVLNLVPSIARHGPQVLQRMLDEARGHAAQLVNGSQTQA